LVKTFSADYRNSFTYNRRFEKFNLRFFTFCLKRGIRLGVKKIKGAKKKWLDRKFILSSAIKDDSLHTRVVYIYSAEICDGMAFASATVLYVARFLCNRLLQ